MIHALMVLAAIVGTYKLGFHRGVNAGAKDAAQIAIELIEQHYQTQEKACQGATSKATPQSTGKRALRVSEAYPQYTGNGYVSRRNAN